MSRITRIAAALATVIAVAAVAAPAVHAAPAPAPVARAVSIAERYWGAVPCQNGVRVIAGQSVPAGLASDSDAWVTFASSLGDNDLSAPASSFRDCAITLGRARWPTAASMGSDWDMLCMTVVHEMGHLLGRPHDETPGSVMAPVFRDYSAEPAACRTARPAVAR